MCGIYGYIAKGKGRLNLRLIQEIALDAERRGPHAFGFAWVDREGRLHHFKKAGRISDSLGLLSLAADARVLIGHCRWATQGNPEDNNNNHPFACDGGFLIHNGVVKNYDALLEEQDLWPTTDCDSEAIARLVEQETGNHLARCVKAVNRVEPSDLAIAVVWGRPPRVAIVRRGKPLWQARSKKGSLYFATRRFALPGDPEMMADHTAEMWAPAGLLQVSNHVD